MDSSAVIIVASLVIAALAVLFVVTTSVRRDRARAEAMVTTEVIEAGDGRDGRDVEKQATLARRERDEVARPEDVAVERIILDDEQISVSRRQFFNRGIVALFGLTIAGFGAQSIAFLWPTASGGFGSKISAGKLTDILDTINTSKEPFYVPEGRFYINPFPVDDVSKAKQVNSYAAVLPGMEEGVVALYQKCPHLGCRVPWCKTSQWFECPCHGSQYSRVGEKKAGPAPRGLDRFSVSVEGGSVVVDTGNVIQGPPIGTNTTGQEAEGPHCR